MVFDEFDYSRDGNLQLDEAKDAMIKLNLFTTQQDFENIYNCLDTDESGSLDWQEFQALAARQAVTNAVIDYIPLPEITRADFEVRPKNSSGSKGDASRPVNGSGREESCLSTLPNYLLSTFEAVTGIDVDGDGHANNSTIIPDYNADTHELHLIIPTALENGHNMGRVYVHVVPQDMAQSWVSSLNRAIKAAVQRKKQKQLEEEFGHSFWSYRRAQAREMYESFPFQMTVFALIVLGFFIDIAEAQILPEAGSGHERTFFILDASITAAFIFELMINLFAHSNDGFKPFTKRASNWFDTAIVIVSIVNVILAGMDIEFFNAKLLRLLRIGRVVRLFSSLKDFQKLVNAISASVLPVCNAFAILLLVAAVYAILGTNFFGQRAPEYFATFHTSLFTMFQVLNPNLNPVASHFRRAMASAGEEDRQETDARLHVFHTRRLGRPL